MASTPEERAARREEAAKYIGALVEKARAAQKIAENFTQEDVDLMTAAVTYNLTKPEKAKMFAEMLVEESGMGIAEDKVGKIYGKVWGSYIMMKDKKVLVFGMARSGIAAAKLLLLRGARVWVCDAKAEADFDGALDDLKAAGATLCLGEQHPENLLEGMDAMVISPGIPVEHPAVVRAKALGVEVMGEVEYARACCWRSPAPTARRRPPRCWARSSRTRDGAPSWWATSARPIPARCPR